MKKLQIVVVITTVLYLLLIIFPRISLTGYWIDAILIALLATVGVTLTYSSPIQPKSHRIFLKTTSSLLSVLLGLFLILHLIIPFMWPRLNVTSQLLQEVDGRYFNVYSHRVGAWGSGHGTLWISETSKYLPIIEKQCYYKAGSLFILDEKVNYESDRTGQQKLTEFIRREIIDKENAR